MTNHGHGLPPAVVIVLTALTLGALFGSPFLARKVRRRPGRPEQPPLNLARPVPQARDTYPYAAMDGVTIGYSDDPGNQDPG